MFTGRGQEPLTSPRARQDTGRGSPILSGQCSAPGAAARAGGWAHTRARVHTHTHTHVWLLPPDPLHLNTISQDVEKISSLEGEERV